MRVFIFILMLLQIYSFGSTQEHMLYKKLHDYNASIVRDEIKFSKYKQKIYIKNELYAYKNCYVDTHYFDINTRKGIINIVTKNDTCDKYMLKDFKAYSFKKALIALQEKFE